MWPAGRQLPIPDLGLSIFPSIQTTVSVNYNSTLRQVESDLERWSSISNSFRARASIVKMNILPRVNFCSSMLPLAPPVGHWDKLHTFVSRYVWKGKRPRIKMSILQRHSLVALDFQVSSFIFGPQPFVLFIPG